MPELKFLHYRYVDDNDNTFEPRGGFTVAYEEISGNLPKVRYGYAMCSAEDAYDKAVGRMIANDRMFVEPMTFLGTGAQFRYVMDFQQATFHALKRRNGSF